MINNMEPKRAYSVIKPKLILSFSFKSILFHICLAEGRLY